MAIARGAGTEIIRSASFEAVDDTQQVLIYGVQHHIYTVLSIIARCNARSGTEVGWLTMQNYDATAGTTNRNISLVDMNTGAGETFVWDTKFSFNGFEPTDFAGPMDDATKQDAIADQGGNHQYLRFATPSASTNYDLHITYIDQNNA
jgi:hypothetical protein